MEKVVARTYGLEKPLVEKSKEILKYFFFKLAEYKTQGSRLSLLCPSCG